MLRRVLYPTVFNVVVIPQAIVTVAAAVSTEAPVVINVNVPFQSQFTIDFRPGAAPVALAPVFSDSPVNFAKGFPAKLAQDGTDWAPVATAVVVAAGAPASSLEPVVTQTSTVLSEPDNVPPPQAVVQVYGAFPQDPFKVSYGFPAKLAQDGSELAPTQPVVPSPVFAQLPERFWKASYPARLQQDGTDLAPFGVTFSPPVFAQSPERFAKGYPSYLVPYGGGGAPFVPTVVTVQYGAFPQYPDVFAKPFPAKLQWAGPDWPPQFVPSVVVPYGQFPQDPALFWKPNYPAFRQQDGSDYAPLVVTFQFTAALFD